MDEKTKLMELLLSYTEGEITVEQLRDALEKVKPAYETNLLLNQITQQMTLRQYNHSLQMLLLIS
jgi:hypothetical protein